MLICGPCRAWFLDVIQIIFIDSKLRKRRDHDFNLTGNLVSCSHERDTSDFIRGKYSCWFCCHLFIIINAHTPGRLSASLDAVAAVSSEDGTASPFKLPPTETDDRTVPNRHRSISSDFCTISSDLGSSWDSYPSLIISCGGGEASVNISFSLLGRFWTRKIEPRYDWSVAYRWRIRGSKRADFGFEGILSRHEGREQSLRLRSLDPSQWFSADRRDLFEKWLKECLDGHSKCAGRGLSPARLRRLAFDGDLEGHRHETPAERSLPKRLIWIGDQEDDVRLVESASLDSDTIEYAALSHCWGLSPFTVLTVANYHDCRRGISRSDLTRTFIDAITLCRSLSIRYIWIDSFCIVQDSPGDQDWISEAPRMHIVYGNALVTIGAFSSRDGTGGIFRPSNQVLRRTLRIKLPGLPILGPTLCSADSFHFASVEHDTSVLMRRGWCIQEMYLSPRTIRWTNDQLIWKCNTSACSDSSEDLIQEEYAIGPDTISWLGMRREDITSPRCSVSKIDLEWEILGNTFAGSSVTRPEDRYRALSGLATHFHEAYLKKIPKTSYIAGMWEHVLVDSLLWTRAKAARAADAVTPIGVYIPSWSWLGVQGARLNRSDTSSGMSVAEVLKVDLVHTDEDQLYGPLQSASLHIKTFVFSFSVGLEKLVADREGVTAGSFKFADTPAFDWYPYEGSSDHEELILDDGRGFTYRLNAPRDERLSLTPELQKDIRSPWICALLQFDANESRLTFGALLLEAVATGHDHEPHEAEEDRHNIYRRVGTIRVGTYPVSLPGGSSGFGPAPDGEGPRSDLYSWFNTYRFRRRHIVLV